MTHKLAKKLFKYYCDTTSESSPNIYIIHLIDENGEISHVVKIDYVLSTYRFTFEFGEEVFQLWEEEIDESQIFVFKQINWNRLLFYWIPVHLLKDLKE